MRPGQKPYWVWVWLCLWLLAEVFAVYTFFWMVAGAEIVTVDQRQLVIKRDIFGQGLTRAFALHELSNLRASGHFGSMFSWTYNLEYWGLAGGTVAVDWRGKTQRFGIQLSEAEAQTVVHQLKEYLP